MTQISTSQQKRLLSCAECHHETIKSQRRSLDSSAKWLMECAFADKEASVLPDPNETNLLSYAPMCEELKCEAPIRRDEFIISRTTGHVQNVISPGTAEYPDLHARLLKGALRWAKNTVFVPENTRLSTGQASILTALISNNLVYGANQGETLPSVASNSLWKATEPSLNKLEETFQPDNIFKDTVSAGDLITIHLLNRGVQKVLEYASSYQEPETIVTYESQKGKIITLGITGFLCLLFGIIIIKAPLFPLLIVNLCFIMPIVFLWKGKKVEMTPEGITWAKNLRTFVKKHEKHNELFQRLKDCDLIDNSKKLFVDTPVHDPYLTACVLRGVHATPGAPLALSYIARNLAGMGQDVLHLSELCTNLVLKDGLSRGADIASLLLVELLYAFPLPDGNSPFWEIMATEDDLGVGGNLKTGMPQLLVRLTRRAVSIRNSRKFWSSREGNFVRRCTHLAKVLLARKPLSDPYWHLLMIRYMRHMLQGGAAGVHFLSDSGCTLVEMCKRVEEIRDAYVKVTATEGDLKLRVKHECEAVVNMEGFFATPKMERLSPLQFHEQTDHETYLDKYLSRQFGGSRSRSQSCGEGESELTSHVPASKPIKKTSFLQSLLPPQKRDTPRKQRKPKKKRFRKS